MYSGKPIIGIAGGIGSGKSYVARLFGEWGCVVIDSDAQVTDAYADPQVLKTLVEWWGPLALTPAGAVNRREVAARIFGSPEQRKRLEGLLHPLVGAARDRQMAANASNSAALAFVWDTPLLYETGLNESCDAIVFVEADLPDRLTRVAATRGWAQDELLRRENFQWPLDKKRQMSDYVVNNAAGTEDLRTQVRETLSRILAKNTLDVRPG